MRAAAAVLKLSPGQLAVGAEGNPLLGRTELSLFGWKRLKGDWQRKVCYAAGMQHLSIHSGP